MVIEEPEDTVDWPSVWQSCAIRVTDLLADVELPNPWSIDEFLDRLERHRGREIDLCAVSWTVGEATGAWKKDDGYDVIAYPANASGPHQDHIILHEIGHMLSDHCGRCVLSVSQAQEFAPNLLPTALAHLLDSTTTATDEAEAEAEAEAIATLIGARILRDRMERSTEVVADPVQQRLAAAFGL